MIGRRVTFPRLIVLSLARAKGLGLYVDSRHQSHGLVQSGPGDQEVEERTDEYLARLRGSLY